MPDTTTARAPTNTTTAETTHWWCCNPDIALCGTDLTDAPEVPDDIDVNCVVCTDIVNEPCRLCGRSD